MRGPSRWFSRRRSLIAPPSSVRRRRRHSRPAPIFRAGADAVTVDASVQRDRRPVIGLKAADFELLDNGVPQQITEVAYEKLPIDVTLLLDVSASVTGDVLDELRRALRQVRTDLGPGDRLRLLTFNMRVRRLVDFTQPAADIDGALASLRGAGSSAVFDAPGRRARRGGCARPAAADRALQRRTGQQQHHRRRRPARRSQPEHPDRRHRFSARRSPDRPASLLRTTLGARIGNGRRALRADRRAKRAAW